MLWLVRGLFLVSMLPNKHRSSQLRAFLVSFSTRLFLFLSSLTSDSSALCTRAFLAPFACALLPAFLSFLLGAGSSAIDPALCLPHRALSVIAPDYTAAPIRVADPVFERQALLKCLEHSSRCNYRTSYSGLWWPVWSARRLSSHLYCR